MLQYQTDLRIAQYQLLRATGQRLDANIELTDSLSDSSFAAGELDVAIRNALEARLELRASGQRLAAARVTEAAEQAGRLPTVHSFGNYGGVNAAGAIVSTDAIGVELRIPLWMHVDVAPFFDAGNVASRYSDLNFDKTSVGAGVRLHTTRVTFARADVAHGSEGWRFVFRTSDPFKFSRIRQHLAQMPFAP